MYRMEKNEVGVIFTTAPPLPQNIEPFLPRKKANYV
jgi:hypothetical protein